MGLSCGISELSGPPFWEDSGACGHALDDLEVHRLSRESPREVVDKPNEAYLPRQMILQARPLNLRRT